jgi:hypothetical protein
MQNIAAALLVLAGCSTTTGKVAGTVFLTTAIAGDSMMIAGEHQDLAAGLIATSCVALLVELIAETRAQGERDRAALGREATSTSVGGYPRAGASRGDSLVGGAAPATTHEGTTERPVLIPGYDRTGAYAGRTDAQGNVYDRTGAYAGRTDGDRYYGATGAYAGRQDGNNYYDATGAYAGRTEANNYYDGSGAYAGRIDDSGNLYDATGGYAGRVDPSCDAACRTRTIGRLLTQHR